MKKYEQIQHYILSQINAGKLSAIDPIESEKELGERFNVSRMTVRRALDELVAQDILFRVQGKGTFVNKSRRFKEFNRLKSFTEEATEAGLSVYSIVISQYEAAPDAAIASIMDIAPQQKVTHVNRIRMADDAPLAYEEAVFLSSVLGDMGPEVPKGSVYKYLEEVKGVKIAYGNQDLDAVSADSKLSIMLNVPLNTPLLRMTCIGYTKSNTIFEYIRTYYRCDRYTFSQIAVRG